MIKILKEGKLPKFTKTIYKAICPHCSCKFEFEIDDCKEIERRVNGNWTIECPYCHKDITQPHFDFEYREEELEGGEQ